MASKYVSYPITKMQKLLSEYAGAGQWIKCSYTGCPGYFQPLILDDKGCSYTLITCAERDLVEFISDDTFVPARMVRYCAAHIRYMRWSDFISVFKILEPLQLYSLDELTESSSAITHYIGKDIWVQMQRYGPINGDFYVNILSKDHGTIKFKYLKATLIDRIFQGDYLDAEEHESVYETIYEDKYSATLDSLTLVQPIDAFTTAELIEAWQQCEGYDDYLDEYPLT